MIPKTNYNFHAHFLWWCQANKAWLEKMQWEWATFPQSNIYLVCLRREKETEYIMLAVIVLQTYTN